MARDSFMAWIAAIFVAVFNVSAANAFGALALDSYRGSLYGYSYNYANVADARARALKECGAACTVVVTFQNTCAAFAADQSHANGATGWGYAPTKEQAQNTAISFCRKYGGTSCLVRVWACESFIGKDGRATREGNPLTQDAVAAIPPAQATPAPAATVPRATTPPAPAPIAPIVPPPVSSADGARRIALVIGNDAYQNLDRLQKAVNDARTIAASLTMLGFEVIRVEDAPRRTMNQKIVEFASKVGPGDIAFFFYSGHGVEIRGVNYLLAVDTPTAKEGEESLITSEGIPADTIVDQLQQRGAKVSMLVLDACRENPFKVNGTRGIGATRGLAQITTPEGVFVLYSAGVGQTALDRLSDTDSNPNSVFTRTFANVLTTPGMTVQEMAKTTQAEVRKLAGTIHHQQMPAYYDQILGEFTFTQAR
ncbi:MAG: caspase family protein [Bradyrhizobiaceae bacterium]|nr:caspase family protein [Bradyrhizobiaceae bacterium]